MKALTIIQENHSGLLAEVTTLLEKQGIPLIDFAGQVVGDTAVISLTVEPYKETFRLLSDAGYRVVTSDHLLVRLRWRSFRACWPMPGSTCAGCTSSTKMKRLESWRWRPPISSGPGQCCMISWSGSLNK